MTTRGTSNRALAHAARVSPQRIAMLLSGARPTASVDLACRIESALGADPGDLFAVPPEHATALEPYLPVPPVGAA